MESLACMLYSAHFARGFVKDHICCGSDEAGWSDVTFPNLYNVMSSLVELLRGNASSPHVQSDLLSTFLTSKHC